MTGFRRRFLLVIAATLGLAAAAWAEAIFPVNDAGTGNWVFDQPSVVANGTVLHVAFVGNNAAGADNASLNTRLYYAAVNGAANFTNKATTRSQVLVTAPVAIDNALFNQARHPQIALRSATELAILFQAIPVGDNTYKLFLAQVTIGNNAVTSQRVDEIRDAAGARIPGKLTDPSFALVPNGATMVMAFSSSPSLVAVPPYSDVYYARVGLDNARVVDNLDPPDEDGQQHRRVGPPPPSARRQQLQPHRLGGQQPDPERSDADDSHGSLLRIGVSGPAQRRGQDCDRRDPGPLGRLPLGIPQRAPVHRRQHLDPRRRRTVRFDGIGGIRRNRRDQPLRRDARREPGERQQRRSEYLVLPQPAGRIRAALHLRRVSTRGGR